MSVMNAADSMLVRDGCRMVTGDAAPWIATSIFGETMSGAGPMIDAASGEILGSQAVALV